MPNTSHTDSAPADYLTRPNDANEALHKQIQWHEHQDDQRSWLASALGLAYSADKRSLEQLKTLQSEYAEAEQTHDEGRAQRLQKGMEQAIKDDREAVLNRARYDDLFAGGVKLAALMTPAGKFTRQSWLAPLAIHAATASLFGLDETKVGNSAAANMAEFGLGCLKGAGTKYAFDSIGASNWNPFLKGAAMGTSARFTNAFLTADNYMQDGQFHPLSGLAAASGQAFDSRAMMLDGCLYLAGGALGSKLGGLAGEGMTAAMLGRAIAGSTFGAPSGFLSELQRQSAAGEPTNLAKAFLFGAQQGAIDALAAMPGGLRARSLATVFPETGRQTQIGHNDSSEPSTERHQRFRPRGPMTEQELPPYKRVNNPFGVDLDEPEIRLQIERWLKSGHKPEHITVSMYGSVDFDAEAADADIHNRK